MEQLPWEWITGPVAALALSVLANVAQWKDGKALRAELSALNKEYQQFLQRLTERANKGGTDV